jgi:hypothetical protein
MLAVKLSHFARIGMAVGVVGIAAYLHPIDTAQGVTPSSSSQQGRHFDRLARGAGHISQTWSRLRIGQSKTGSAEQVARWFAGKEDGYIAEISIPGARPHTRKVYTLQRRDEDSPDIVVSDGRWENEQGNSFVLEGNRLRDWIAGQQRGNPGEVEVVPRREAQLRKVTTFGNSWTPQAMSTAINAVRYGPVGTIVELRAPRKNGSLDTPETSHVERLAQNEFVVSMQPWENSSSVDVKSERELVSWGIHWRQTFDESRLQVRQLEADKADE